MKVDGFGYNNAVSAETSVLNDDQARVLIELGCRDIVFAFDQDVSFNDALKSARKVKHWANCYVMYDRNGLLQAKDSPCDRGKEVWDRLYKERQKIV
jgi:DNA primase